MRNAQPPIVAEWHVRSFERVLCYVHVSRRLFWSTAAENVDYDGSALVLLDGDERARSAVDRERVLFGDTFPRIEGDGPLRGVLAWDDFRNGSLSAAPADPDDLLRQLRGPGPEPALPLLSPHQRHDPRRQHAHDRDTAVAEPWPPTG